MGHPLQVEAAENGHLRPRVQLLHAIDLLAIGQGQGRPQIAAAMTIQKRLHGLVTGPQQHIPQVLLDLVKRRSLLQCRGEYLDQFGHDPVNSSRLRTANGSAILMAGLLER